MPTPRKFHAAIELLETRIAPAVTVGFSLFRLDGADGFTIASGTNSAASGFSVSAAGDVNGDGFDDVIVGQISRSSAYVVFGKAGGWTAGLSLPALDGTDGFRLFLNEPYGGGYTAVSAAGDVNGDGFDDVIIGKERVGGPGVYGAGSVFGAGAAYVVFGKSGGFAAEIDLGTLDGGNGFKLTGVAPRDFAGRAVAGGGDVNGDGFDDVLIGAFGADEGGAGYVVFGHAGAFLAETSLASLNGTNGFKLSGMADGASVGRTISVAGDVNGDGFDDILMGAPGASEGGDARGAGYVIFGKATGFDAAIPLASLNGSNGFKVSGADRFGFLGSVVSGIGDVNGDGFDEVAFAPYYGQVIGITRNPTVYVVLGKAGGFAPQISAGSLDGTNGFAVVGPAEPAPRTGIRGFFGQSVSAAGDVNGDGFDDFIVSDTSAAEGGRDRGATYVFFGGASGFPARVSVDTLDGVNGYRLIGVADRDYSGSSISAAGDVNGDGFDDIIIGAPNANADGIFTGRSYVVFGRPSPATVGFSLSGNQLAFIDPDGDRVTVALSNGKLAKANVTLEPLDGGMVLRSLDLTKSAAPAGARLKITAEPLGVARVEVGTITIADRAKVARIDVAGDLTALSVAPGGRLSALKVQSTGAAAALFGADARLEFGSKVGKFEVEGDVRDTSMLFVAGAAQVRVGGDWIASSLHTQRTITLLHVEGDARDALWTGAGPEQPRSVSLTNLFGTVKVGGDFERSNLLAGYTALGLPERGGRIGRVSIGGDFITSNIVAGAGAGGDQVFGTRDDFAIADGDRFVSAIGKIVIAGNVIGTGGAAAGYGIVAEQIDTLQVGSTRTAWQKGAGNDLALQSVGLSDEVRAREVAASVVVRSSLSRLDGATGFALAAGETIFNFASTVSSAGDINGDGFDDIMLMAGQNDHQAYVVFGRAGGFDPQFTLSGLDGTDGFKITGMAIRNDVGRTVSAAGDVNGDGFDDLIVGAGYDNEGGAYSGAAYVVFGKASGFAAELAVSTLDGGNGFKLIGSAPGDGFGHAVSGAGDVNNDGFDDVLVGARLAAEGGFRRGAAYLVFGKSGGFDAQLAVSTLDGTDGFTLTGGADRDFAGYSVSAAGDVNGDGFDDIIVGAIRAEQTGAAYVIFGRATPFPAQRSLSTLDGTDGFRLSGVSLSDSAGFSVSGAGDVNDDGFDDVIVGALNAAEDGLRRGAAYVLFGSGSGFSAQIALATLDGGNGFKLSGERDFDNAGRSVSGAGDVNGDGFADIIVGATGSIGLTVTPGSSYVIFGQSGSFGPRLALAQLNGINGFVLGGGPPGDLTGISVSGAGDFNGDGFDDLITGAAGLLEHTPAFDTTGRAYVVFGTPAQQIDDQTIAFTEADGDRVIVQVKKGTISTGALQFEEVAGQKIYNVKTLDLSDAAKLNGAEVSVTVVSSSGSAALQGRAGNVGIPNVGTVIFPNNGGPTSVSIAGNVQQVTLPGGAKLKNFTVRSLGVDADIFPTIAPRFNGAGTIVKLTVEGDITGVEFDVPGAVDRMTVGGGIVDSTLNFANKLATLAVSGDVSNSVLAFAKGAGSVTVFGDVTDTRISALGALLPAKAAALFGKVTVGGDFERSKLLAGYDAAGLAANADAALGAIKIIGALRESSIVAGASAGVDGIFGTGDDALIAGGSRIVAKIASIRIGGVEGSVALGDGFGIVAEHIGSLKIDGVAKALARGAANDLNPALLGTTDDVRVREVGG